MLGESRNELIKVHYMYVYSREGDGVVHGRFQEQLDGTLHHHHQITHRNGSHAVA
jgi:hypothetical protein